MLYHEWQEKMLREVVPQKVVEEHPDVDPTRVHVIYVGYNLWRSERLNDEVASGLAVREHQRQLDREAEHAGHSPMGWVHVIQRPEDCDDYPFPDYADAVSWNFGWIANRQDSDLININFTTNNIEEKR